MAREARPGLVRHKEMGKYGHRGVASRRAVHGALSAAFARPDTEMIWYAIPFGLPSLSTTSDRHYRCRAVDFDAQLHSSLLDQPDQLLSARIAAPDHERLLALPASMRCLGSLVGAGGIGPHVPR